MKLTNDLAAMLSEMTDSEFRSIRRLASHISLYDIEVKDYFSVEKEGSNHSVVCRVPCGDVYRVNLCDIRENCDDEMRVYLGAIHPEACTEYMSFPELLDKIED